RLAQGCGPRLSMRARSERLGTERAKRLYEMSVGGEEIRDHGRCRLSVGKRSAEPALAVELDRIRRVDDDLAVEQISVLGDQLLGRVEPDGEDHRVRRSDRLPNRRRARQRAKVASAAACD